MTSDDPYTNTGHVLEQAADRFKAHNDPHPTPEDLAIAHREEHELATLAAAEFGDVEPVGYEGDNS